MEHCCCEKKTVRSEEDKKALISRINRIAGQMNGIRRMVEEDRYCDDLLVQLAAVDKSVKSLSALVLEKHLHGCVVESIQQGELGVLDELVELFRKF